MIFFWIFSCAILFLKDNRLREDRPWDGILRDSFWCVVESDAA